MVRKFRAISRGKAREKGKIRVVAIVANLLSTGARALEGEGSKSATRCLKLMLRSPFPATVFPPERRFLETPASRRKGQGEGGRDSSEIDRGERGKPRGRPRDLETTPKVAAIFALLVQVFRYFV